MSVYMYTVKCFIDILDDVFINKLTQMVLNYFGKIHIYFFHVTAFLALRWP